MDIITDASALLAVILDEPERDRIIEQTSGHTLMGPGSIPWEIGNAFSSMFREQRIGIHDAQQGLRIFSAIPLRYVDVDFENAIAIAAESRLYAYDAYYLDCVLRHAAPLLTLDRRLKIAARKLGAEVLEV